MYWFHSKCSYAFEVLSRVKSMFDPHCKGNQTESIGKWNVVQKRSPITWLQSFERSLSHLIVWKQSISARLCFHLWHITSAETGTKDAKDQQLKGLHQITPFLSISGFIKPFFVWNLMASRNLLSGFMFDFQAYQWDDSNWADISDGYQDYPITHNNFKRELQNITDKNYPNLKEKLHHITIYHS